MKLAGKVVKSEDHMQAALLVEKQCASRKLNRDGFKHLRKLIHEKSRVSYGNRRTTPDIALALAVNSERFERWARQTLEGLA